MATVRNFLDVSTAHLSDDDRAFLADDSPAETDFGWFSYVHSERPDGMSDQLWAILRLAASHECSWILFDEDSAESDELPILDPVVLQEREQPA